MATEKPSDLMSSGAGLASAVALESHGELGEVEAVKARGYWEQVWLRFKRDKVAIAGGVFIIFLLLFAFRGAPIAAKILGHGPNEIFAGGLDPDSQLPVGPLTWISTEPYPGAPGNFEDTFFVLGADSQLGRDMFLRLLYGAQTSLQVAVLATFLSVSIGLVMGLMAGYYRGGVDTIVSRLTEIVMAFPSLLFIIAVAATVGERLIRSPSAGSFSPGCSRWS